MSHHALTIHTIAFTDPSDDSFGLTWCRVPQDNGNHREVSDFVKRVATFSVVAERKILQEDEADAAMTPTIAQAQQLVDDRSRSLAHSIARRFPALNVRLATMPVSSARAHDAVQAAVAAACTSAQYEDIPMTATGPTLRGSSGAALWVKAPERWATSWARAGSESISPESDEMGMLLIEEIRVHMRSILMRLSQLEPSSACDHHLPASLQIAANTAMRTVMYRSAREYSIRDEYQITEEPHQGSAYMVGIEQLDWLAVLPDINLAEHVGVEFY